MTDSTLSRLPLLAGGAVAASLSRAGLWTFSRYMRAPFTSTALLAMVTLTALAGSNALYFQTARHPAPLFAPTPDVPETASVVAAPDAPVLPQLRQAEAPQPVSQETTSSVAPVVEAPVVPAAPVGNTQVFELQKKLTELKLFNGTVDGFYGPMTARAIRAFEERNGMTPTGAISPAVVDAILRADAMGMAPQTVRVADAAPQPVAAPVVRPKAQLPPVALAPVNAVRAETPVEDTFDAVTNSAAQTIDSIVAAVDGSRTTPTAPAVRPTPSQPLLAASAQPMPAPVQHVASLEPIAPPAVIVPQQAVPQQQEASIAPPARLNPANNAQLIEQVQRGLASLGFLQGAIDGKPGEATAKAIRAFEIFHNYAPTGEATPQLVGLLRDAGASI